MAIEMTKQLGEIGEKVDLLFTVDPVPHAMKLMLKKSKLSKSLPQRPENAIRMVNHYQNLDENSMPFITLRGTVVEGADENIELFTKDSYEQQKFHVLLLRQRLLHDKFYCELSGTITEFSCK